MADHVKSRLAKKIAEHGQMSEADVNEPFKELKVHI